MPPKALGHAWHVPILQCNTFGMEPERVKATPPLVDPGVGKATLNLPDAQNDYSQRQPRYPRN